MKGTCRFVWALLLLLPAGWGLSPFPARGETISGEACYTFSDRESLNAARYIAIALAKREALEKYAPFKEATANVREATLKNQIVTAVTARAIRTLKVTKETENGEKREVCRNIETEVEPGEVKALIAGVIAAYRAREAPPATGLPGNENTRVVKTAEAPCPRDPGKKCLQVVVECRRNTFGERQPLRIIWYDVAGNPVFSDKERVRCEVAWDIHQVSLPLPPPDHTFTLDFPGE